MMENTPKDPFASTSINYGAIACRRRWWLLGSVLVVWVLAFAASRLIPPTYTSRAIVLVSHTGIPSSYVELNVKGDLTARLRNISQRVFDHSHLAKIVDDYHLYPKLRARQDAEQVVNAMQRDIQIDPLPADDAAGSQAAGNEDPAQAARRALAPQNGKTPDAIAFRLSYTAPDRIAAQQVANELISLMIESNMQDRRSQSQTTTDFLQSQTAQVLDQMIRQQQKIQAFKTQYIGELPDQKESNLQSLSQLQSRLQSANDALSKAQQQKVYLHSLSSQYKELQAGLATEKSSVQSPEAVNQQVEKLQKQLDDLRARYTDDHPDVRTLQKEIVGLKAAKNTSPVAPVTPAKKLADEAPSNPHPKTYAELQALSPVLQTEGQIKSNEAEIINRQNEVAAAETQVAHYQKLLASTPLREQQLEALTQSYDQLKASYDSLANKSSQSQLATNLEKHDQGESWEILSPPNAPRKASFPDRFMFNLGGLGAGLLVGIALVIFKEFADERIFEEPAVSAVIPRTVAILARIPSLRTPPETKRRRWRIALEWAAGTTMFVIITAITALSYFGG